MNSRHSLALRFCLLAAAACFPATDALGAIQGSPHDFTRLTQDLFKGSCAYCHIPHEAQGESLWVSTPYGPVTGWGSRTVAQLCYTCHDSAGGGYGADNVTQTAYTEAAHGYRMAYLPPLPDGSMPQLPRLPGVGTELLDCSTCHDPHSSVPPFMRLEDIDTLCKSCHDRANPGNIGGQNRFGPDETAYSLHPTDVDYLDLPANGATGLHLFPDRLQEVTASGNWRLGAHRVGWQSGSGNISCQTCHPVHGGWNYYLGLLPGPPASFLTPLENFSGDTSALCQACHMGGDPEETVGIGADHPINSNDGVPGTVFPAGWPAGQAGQVTCSSCHDSHGGMPGTSLQRQGGDTENGWCFSCHSVLNLIPPYHHSCLQNDDPLVFTSVLQCGDCHGRGSGWKAHNGFDGFKVVIGPDNSEICEACHLPNDPLTLSSDAYREKTGLDIDFSEAVFPATHGRVSGGDSHPVDIADSDRLVNCEIKTTPWASSGAPSKYGPAGELLCESCHGVLLNSGPLLGDGEEERLTGGWKTNLLLEAYEDNSPGVGQEVPDYFPGPTLSALCRGCHFSRQEGVDPTFVHNPSAHTVINYLYPPGLTPYGRRTTTMLTTPNDASGESCPEVSSADQLHAPSGLNGGLAPGAYSYPADNLLDCDSCHRPHGADSDSSDDGIHRLLEYTDPGRHGTTPCLECHDTKVQCGFTPVP